MNYVHQPYGSAPPQQQQQQGTSPVYPPAEVGTLPTQATTSSFGLPPGSPGPGTPPAGVSPVLAPQVPQSGSVPSPGVSPHGSRKNSTHSDRRASNASNTSASGLHQNNPHSRQVQVNGPDRPPLLYNPDTGVPIPHLAC